jgi:hypothetical protein
MGGMATGTIPNTVYLARMAYTRAITGCAGKRMNGISTRFMSTLRSSPVMVSVDLPGSLLGASSWRVTIPSMSTLGRPLTVAMMMTRVTMGSK